MEINKLKEVVSCILNQTQPTNNIIQNLSKSEVDEVAKFLEILGHKLIKETISELKKAKPLNYKIEGVSSTGHIPEDHPERQLAVDHINKLMTLPNDHPNKAVAMNVARALQERHLVSPKVVQDVEPKAVTPTAPGPALNYSKINEIKQPEPAAIITYDKGNPSIKVNKKP